MSKKSKKIEAMLQDKEIMRLARITEVNTYCDFTSYPLFLTIVLMTSAYLVNISFNSVILYIALTVSLVIKIIGDLVMVLMIRKDVKRYKESKVQLVNDVMKEYVIGGYSFIRMRLFTSIFEILMFTFYFKMNVGLAEVFSVMLISYLAIMFFVGEKDYFAYKYVHNYLKRTLLLKEDED